MNRARYEFFQQFDELFSWYEIEDEYAYYGVFPVQPKLIEAIQRAATDVWQVMLSAGNIVRTFDDQQLQQYGYFPETFEAIRNDIQLPFIARCDFAVTETGIYLLECNAEVATFVVETFKVNGLVANHFGREDPNWNSESILQQELNGYLQHTAQVCLGKAPEDCNIVFSAIGSDPEDAGTAKYLQSLSAYPARFCPIELIEIDEHCVYDDQNRPIDIIYRIYPTEWMLEDLDPLSGARLWSYLEPLLFRRQVALINPISSMLLQNKALLAFITELAEHRWDEALTEIVHRHFLPCYSSPDFLDSSYVGKPTFGREGSEIEIVHNGKSRLYNPSKSYASFPKIYQKFVELPQIALENQIYALQYSCFLINGKPTGVAVRVDRDVISNTSKFIPIGY
jgi:glutathionylspermidine synthase